MKKVVLLVSLMLSVVVFSPTLVLAETDQGAGAGLNEVCSGESDSPVCQRKDKTLDSLVVKVMQYLMYVVGVASLVFLIYGGILYATSSGKPDALTKAKKTIIGAITGLAVALLALAIVNLVKGTVDEMAPSAQSQEQEESE